MQNFHEYMMVSLVPTFFCFSHKFKIDNMEQIGHDNSDEKTNNIIQFVLRKFYLIYTTLKNDSIFILYTQNNIDQTKQSFFNK